MESRQIVGFAFEPEYSEEEIALHHGCCWLYYPGRAWAWFVMVRVSFSDIKQALQPCKLFV